ncbi:serine/threonine protein kinase [Streptomyces griseofuscus]|uniref:Serine/threonine protein kinase n=1 Tax=Streptomyces griseofuscus TaxID=146922 RepID=A0A7H1PXD2_9ACTN|nr:MULTISPECIES: ATP-binding SpoIIE family protein phosphatase [Streptomyces]MBA9048417.1 anti-sigma regulatory factor (Ser/Thr protein kinase) [Streptomyces murinus]QNT92712.1 serine/threonine protein kinase [Streptomyces griseofuscus]BBC93355.1 serine/threonine protein kinase [Streptomyces rochei]
MSSTFVAEAGDVCWLRADVALAAAARHQAAQLARGVHLSAEHTARLELCVTELATNLLKHAHDGALALRVVRDRDRAAVECLSLDNGPGIEDVPRALRDGTSATGTLGIGLGAVGRLADESGVHSLRGRGTVVYARFWAAAAGGAAPEPRPHPVATGGLTRPISGEQVCGDSWAVRAVSGHGPDALTLMMCDGLGHGPLAARAADRAREAFRDSRHMDPAAVLGDVHLGLRGTRGAAVAIALVDLGEERVRLSGVGNISALVATEGSRSGLLSVPGIVGVQLPRPRTFEAAFPPGSALIMHSDGLSDRWKPADLPGLFAKDPSLVAAQILNQAAVRRDDAGIVVAVRGQRP